MRPPCKPPCKPPPSKHQLKLLDSVPEQCESVIMTAFTSMLRIPGAIGVDAVAQTARTNPAHEAAARKQLEQKVVESLHSLATLFSMVMMEDGPRLSPEERMELLGTACMLAWDIRFWKRVPDHVRFAVRAVLCGSGQVAAEGVYRECAAHLVRMTQERHMKVHGTRLACMQLPWEGAHCMRVHFDD